jgi:NodT family efflux transporter outer membrane factor (OMF) lipoprotein
MRAGARDHMSMIVHGNGLFGRRSFALVCCVCMFAGCKVGPNYTPPPAPTAPRWADAPTTQVSTDSTVQAQWWKSFNDPVLDRLVEMAYGQNLPLQIAGLRVLEARAIRGIEVGRFFPQMQSLNASYSHIGLSKNIAGLIEPRFFDSNNVNFDAAWELDAWGKFRRGIESADASLYASVMNYDDVLVTLVADVATTYINLRGLDERIKLAQENVTIQQSSLDIANVRFRAGGTSELDVQQATGQLKDTQALVPALQLQRRQTENQLCVLLGIPPQDLAEILGSSERVVPQPPAQAAVGIPADLLRRRPDIRRAEAAAAAQCAQIGVAKADLYPHFSLFGTIGYAAENGGELFNNSSLTYQIGPSFRWDLLNYGRITNNVRVQDARFEQLIKEYQNTVLTAQQDVSNSITGLVRSREQVGYLADSVTASRRSVDLSFTQYRAGGVDFIRVLNATQFLLQEQQNLVISRVNVAASAIALNKALGGGWELRKDDEFVPAETIDEMRKRTNWGGITTSDYPSKKDMLLFTRPAADVPPYNRPAPPEPK